jgi:hypothetical protein
MILIELGTYRYGKSTGFGAPITLKTRGNDRGLEAGHLSHAGASRVFAAPVWAYLLGLPGWPDFAPSSHLVEETQQRVVRNGKVGQWRGSVQICYVQCHCQTDMGGADLGTFPSLSS